MIYLSPCWEGSRQATGRETEEVWQKRAAVAYSWSSQALIQETVDLEEEKKPLFVNALEAENDRENVEANWQLGRNRKQAH